MNLSDPLKMDGKNEFILFQKQNKSIANVNFALNRIFLFKSKSPTVLVWKHFYCANFHNLNDTLRKHIILHNHRDMFRVFRTNVYFHVLNCNLTCIQFLFKPLEGLMLPLIIKTKNTKFQFPSLYTDIH